MKTRFIDDDVGWLLFTITLSPVVSFIIVSILILILVL
jgi:hypothetical protein